MYPETLFDGREGSDESPTTAIVRHSSSMRRIVSLEFIATTKPHTDDTASIELRIACRSCSECTSGVLSALYELIASTSACAPVIVVTHGTPYCNAARRIACSS